MDPDHFFELDDGVRRTQVESAEESTTTTTELVEFENRQSMESIDQTTGVCCGSSLRPSMFQQETG